MKYEPELGQFAFGCPTGRYELPEFANALLDYILEGIERVYWNVNQAEWNRHDDPKIKRIEFNPYYWGEGEEERERPNFKFKNIEIRWYKYPGRGTSCNIEMTANQWKEWFDECLKIIRKQDVLLK